MSILNVNQLQPVGGGNTITVGSSNIDYSGSITGNISVDGNLTVTGVVSNEDVTNIDSVGVVTARSDISIADKIVHTGDTNTAIRFPAADTFTVETGGSERFRIDSTGNTLIYGVLRKDNVNSSLSISGGNGADSSANIVLHGSSGSPANITQFRTGSTERLRIRSDGKISAGTLLDTNNSYEFSIRGADGTGCFYAHGRNHYLSTRSTSHASLTLKKSNADSDNIDYLQLRDSANAYLSGFSGAGNLKPASGKGIDFSNNSHSGGMTSEILDDYEEGTFTPTVYGSTTAGTFNIVSGGSNEGWYVKIGQYVHMIIRWKNVYLTGASGNLTLGNLPFSFDNTNARLGGFSSYLEGFTPSYNKSFSGSQSVCFRRANATSVGFRPSSADEWDVYYNAAAVSWQRSGGNSSQRTYGEIHLYGHTPS